MNPSQIFQPAVGLLLRQAHPVRRFEEAQPIFGGGRTFDPEIVGPAVDVLDFEDPLRHDAGPFHMGENVFLQPGFLLRQSVGDFGLPDEVRIAVGREAVELFQQKIRAGVAGQRVHFRRRPKRRPKLERPPSGQKLKLGNPAGFAVVRRRSEPGGRRRRAVQDEGDKIGAQLQPLWITHPRSHGEGRFRDGQLGRGGRS